MCKFYFGVLCHELYGMYLNPLERRTALQLQCTPEVTGYNHGADRKCDRLSNVIFCGFLVCMCLWDSLSPSRNDILQQKMCSIDRSDSVDNFRY